MSLPQIATPAITYVIWRWRKDCQKWVRVATRPHLSEAIARRNEPDLAGQHTRITRDVTTRTVVE